MLVEKISEPLVFLFQIRDDRLLVSHFVEERVRVRLQLSIHSVGRVKFIVALAQRVRNIRVLVVELVVSSLQIFEVARLGRKLLTHRVLQVVERELEVLNV